MDRTLIKRFAAGFLVALSGVAVAATFNLFQPATGVLKGNASTYVTTAAISTDIRGLWTGTCDASTYLRGDGSCQTPPGTGGGTVNSVGLSAPSVFSVSGSPVTSTGTLALTFASGQTANSFLATPDGAPGAVSLRTITLTDLPTIPLLTNTSGTLTVGRGGTGATTLTNHGVLVGAGTSAASGITALTDDQLLQGATGANPAGVGVPNCGSSTQALAYNTTTHAFGCQTISAGTGTVTSVGLSAPSVFAVGSTPVTTSGTLALTFATGQTANQVLASPNGSSGAVGLRALVGADLPLVSLATGVTGNLPVTNLNGGSGATGSTYWAGDGTWKAAGATPANPTAAVGLATVNGSAATFMRSDGAPALSQSIAPTWSAAHTFSQVAGGTTFPIVLSSALPGILWNETDQGADNKAWATYAESAQLAFVAANDAGTASSPWMTVLRSGTTPTSVDITATAVKANGSNICTASGANCPAANPSAVVGLTAVNGSAATFMRSDGAPALSPAIVPTWTGVHTFSGATDANTYWHSNAATNYKEWLWNASGSTGAYGLYASNDARNAFSRALQFSRSAAIVSAIDIGNTTDNPAITLSGTAVTLTTPGGSSGLFIDNAGGPANARSTLFHTSTTSGGGLFASNDAHNAFASILGWTRNTSPAVTDLTFGSGSSTYTFSSGGTTSFAGPVTNSTVTSGATIGYTSASTLPGYRWNETDAATDAKFWSVYANSGVMHFEVENDALNSGADWMTVTRSGQTVTNLAFGNATNNPTYSFPSTADTTFSGSVISPFVFLGASSNSDALGSGGGELRFFTNAAVRMAINHSDGGVTVGSPTGGSKGAGTVNATGVYVNGASLKTLPKSATTSGTLTAAEVGGVVPASGGVTINNSVFAAGDTFSVYNDSASSITLTQGSGVTMRLSGTSTTGSRSLAARGIATLWFNSASEVIVTGSGVF